MSIININYQFKALSPIIHCSDETGSNVRTFKRLKFMTPKPVIIESNFCKEDDRLNALSDILFTIYMTKERTSMKIWDEFEAKILAFCSSATKNEFVNRMLESFQCKPITNARFFGLLRLFNDLEFLSIIRQEYKLLVSLVRQNIDFLKKEKLDWDTYELFDPLNVNDTGERLKIVQNYNDIPIISGNGIRGLMRRIMGNDMLELSGIPKKSVPLSVYHMIFTGGTLSGQSNIENIALQKALSKAMPHMRLFGSAIGNQMIQSSMKVKFARLKCKENGLGERSFWEYLEYDFGVRHDSARTDFDLDDPSETDKEKHSMIYQNEVLTFGSEFQHGFVYKPVGEIDESAFYRMLYLWAQNASVGGSTARGYGQIEIMDLDVEGCRQKGEAYCDYMRENGNRLLMQDDGTGKGKGLFATLEANASKK